MDSTAPPGITSTNTLVTSVTTTVTTATTQTPAVMPGGRLDTLTVRQVPSPPAHSGFANFLATLRQTIHPASQPPTSAANDAAGAAAARAPRPESAEEEMLRLEQQMKGFGLHRGVMGRFELEANETFDARRDGPAVLRYLCLRATHPSGMPMTTLHPWVEFARGEMPSAADRAAARRLYLEKTVNLGMRPAENLEQWLSLLERDMRVHPRPPLQMAELDLLVAFLQQPDAAAAALPIRLPERLDALFGPAPLGGVLATLLVSLDHPPTALLHRCLHDLRDSAPAVHGKFLAALLKLPPGDEFTALSAAFVAQVLPHEPPTWHAQAKAALVLLAQGQPPGAQSLGLQAAPPEIWLAIVAKAATACADGPSALRLIQHWMPSACAVGQPYVQLFEAILAEDATRGRKPSPTCLAIHGALRAQIDAQGQRASVSRTVMPFVACCVCLGKPSGEEDTLGWALGQICMGFAHVRSGDGAAARKALSQAQRHVNNSLAVKLGAVSRHDARISSECNSLAQAIAAMPAQ